MSLSYTTLLKYMNSSKTGRYRRQLCFLMTLVLILVLCSKILLKPSVESVIQTGTSETEALPVEQKVRVCQGKYINRSNTVTQKHWDFKLFNRPEFLKNYKNPCFEQNVTETVDGKVNSQIKVRCLPYFLIAGFPKAGTTDMWTRLMLHPDIKLTHIKEPRFFNIARFSEGSFGNAMSRYIMFFDKTAKALQSVVSPKDCNKREFPYYHGITGEGTVDTVFDHRYWPLVPGNENCDEPIIINADCVHHINPNMKIIFVLRNPVERLYSDYIYEARYIHYPISRQLFHKRVLEAIANHTECRQHTSLRACAYNTSIETYEIRLRVGMYNIFISDWLEIFPPENVLVIKAEDTIGMKRIETYKKIFTFLGVRPFTPLEEQVAFQHGPVNTRSRPEKNLGKMLPETRKLVEDFYEPFNINLTKLYPEINYNLEIQQQGYYM